MAGFLNALFRWSIKTGFCASIGNAKKIPVVTPRGTLVYSATDFSFSNVSEMNGKTLLFSSGDVWFSRNAFQVEGLRIIFA